MAGKVKSIPDEYRGATPYLCVQSAGAAIEFYKKAFGAREVMRIPMGDKIGHAELRVGDAPFMLADEFS
jgi:PhnB protein